MAVPITSEISVAIIYSELRRFKSEFRTRIAYRSFSHDIKRNIQPFRKKLSASFCKIESTDTSQLDAQALQENGKNIRHQHDEEELEPVRRTRGNIRGIISRVNICHGYLGEVLVLSYERQGRRAYHESRTHKRPKLHDHIPRL